MNYKELIIGLLERIGGRRFPGLVDSEKCTSSADYQQGNKEDIYSLQ